MLTFTQLTEKKSKVKINPKKEDCIESKKVECSHKEDCQCQKCENKDEEAVVEGSAYGITRGSGKPSGVMKKYLEKKAEKLKKEKAKQSAPYKNNPAFGDASHHSNAKNKTEEVQVEATLATARKNIGRDPKKKSCWDGYKATGTKMKGGKAVPDCKKEEVETVDEMHVTASMGRHAKNYRQQQAAKKDRDDNAKWEEKARTHKWDGKTWNKRDKPTHEKGTGPHAKKAAAANESVVGEGYQRNPERDTRSARQRRMDSPDRGINSQAFRDFMAAQQSKPKKKKEVKEDLVNELNRYGKETGKATGSINKRPGSAVKKGGDTSDKALNYVRGMIRRETGKPEGQRKKTKGVKGNRQYGDRKTTPADSVAKRRQSRADAEKLMRDTSGT